MLDITQKVFYGSNDCGRTVHHNTEVDKVLEKVALHLHLARHVVGNRQLCCAGDVECRQAKNSKHLFLLDMARVLPPEHPAAVKHLEPIGGTVFYRILRPEFLQI